MFHAQMLSGQLRYHRLNAVSINEFAIVSTVEILIKSRCFVDTLHPSELAHWFYNAMQTCLTLQFQANAPKFEKEIPHNPCNGSTGRVSNI
jgi:hypothetical protein